NDNVGEYKIKGIQTNIYFRSLNKKWQASVNYTYIDPKQTSGVKDDDALGLPLDSTFRIGRIASHRANAIINFIFLKNFNINLRANHVGSIKTGIPPNVREDRIRKFDDYIVGNIVVGVQNLIKGTTIQLICNNIFDKVYYS